MRGFAIYDEDVRSILKECCTCIIRRASSVETRNNLPESVRQRISNPDETLWYVSFLPLNDDTLLGPFESRQRALQEETNYLLSYLKNN